MTQTRAYYQAQYRRRRNKRIKDTNDLLKDILDYWDRGGLGIAWTMQTTYIPRIRELLGKNYDADRGESSTGQMSVRQT